LQQHWQASHLRRGDSGILDRLGRPNDRTDRHDGSNRELSNSDYRRHHHKCSHRRYLQRRFAGLYGDLEDSGNELHRDGIGGAIRQCGVFYLDYRQLTFQRSFDFPLIGEIMRHEKLCQADDFAPAREKFVPRTDEAIWYVLVEDAGEVLGLFALAPQNTICWEIHTRLLPCAWGKRAAEAGRGVLEWIWEQTLCRRVVTSIPEYNRLAVRFAAQAGLRRFGVNESSYLKNGILHDQILMGVSKP
jgi:RimJ/RimL family protein N-acetyltransferase